jgi:hypothetical protein
MMRILCAFAIVALGTAAAVGGPPPAALAAPPVSADRAAYDVWQACFEATAGRYAVTAEPAESAARIVALACAEGRRQYQDALRAAGHAAAEALQATNLMEDGLVRAASLAIMESRVPK